MLNFTHQQQTAFENFVGKGEIARWEQFLLFPQCFFFNQIIVSLFVHIFDVISLVAAEFEESKISISGKGLLIPFSQCQALSYNFIWTLECLEYLCKVNGVQIKEQTTIVSPVIFIYTAFKKH